MKKGGVLLYNTRAEMLFWLSVMCDHAIFLQSALSSKEKDYMASTSSPWLQTTWRGKKNITCQKLKIPWPGFTRF
jgi:hypothetical protein